MKSKTPVKWKSPIEEHVDRMEQRWFHGKAGVRVCRETTGQRIDEDGTVVFGARLVNELDHESLAHEMAHFVEIDEGRIDVFGWGLVMGTPVVVAGREYNEFMTADAVMREARVIAIQANLLEAMGLPFDINETIRPLAHIPAICYVHADDAAAIQIVTGWIERLRTVARYSFKRFQHEWGRRCSMMATKVLEAKRARHKEPGAGRGRRELTGGSGS